MILILPPNEYTSPLRELLSPLLPAGARLLNPEEGLPRLEGEKLLFAVSLDEGGCNLAYYRMLAALRRGEIRLDGCTAGVVVTGVGELYTKTVARDLVLAANLAGCAFLGRPLVEATGSLRNFRVQAQLGGTDEATALRLALAELVGRLEEWGEPPPLGRVLALHASVRSTSNTLALWELVKAGLPAGTEVGELGLQNGELTDCIGCSYTTCLHFGQQGRCFYGGPMVEEVFPALRECDTLVMLCANEKGSLVRLPGIEARGRAFAQRMAAL